MNMEVTYKPSYLSSIFISLLLLICSFCVAQDTPQYDDAYKEKFNKVRFLLGGGRTGEAFVLLQDLYAIDSTNHYTNYLMGICYTEQNVVTPLSYEHLKYASENVMDVYTYIPYTETRSPIYVWYYLTKAYSQNGMCKEANETMQKFFKKYGDEENDYFVVHIKEFLLHCKNQQYSIQNKAEKNIVTKDISYTTLSPLYGVQVGAFKYLVPIREEFNNLKNVEAFLDTNGTLRYVVGRFNLKSQANALLNIIKEKGYSDAFIVDVNGASRFSREVIIVDHQSFKAQIRGDIEYRVQIGAYSNTDSIPEHLAKKYLLVEDIQEVSDHGLTLLTTGSFISYNDASGHKNSMQSIGILDAFVVAFNQGRKVSLQAAEKYLENMAQQEENENHSKKKKRKKED